jgi:glycosyl transferase family 25
MANASIDIVVISLDTATQRRAFMSSMLDKSRLNWSYFDAHRNLARPALRYDADESKLRFGRTLGSEQIAVYSSHYSVLRRFVNESKSDILVVFEDDVILDLEFPLVEFARFCAAKGMGYVRLFGRHYANAVKLGFFYDRNLIRYTTSPTGLQAYIVTKHAARVFVERLASINAPVDLAMDRFWELDLPLYGIFPYPVIERFSPTSIPIPPVPDKLFAREKLIWTGHRIQQKAQKIWANVALHKSDARIRAMTGPFVQIGDRRSARVPALT